MSRRPGWTASPRCAGGSSLRLEDTAAEISAGLAQQPRRPPGSPGGVIGKVVPRRGGGVIGLLAYLYREGPAGEKNLCSAHVNPRMIASWDGNPAALEPPVAGAGWRDYARLTQLLEAPVRAAGMPDAAKPVYHLVLAAAKDPATGRLVDPYLTDDQWRDIAEEFMHRLGLAPPR